MATGTNYEQAAELKIGQVGIANLRIRVLNIEKIASEMQERVCSAPKLFERAAIILDFGGLPECPSATETQALINRLKAVGVLPIAIAYGTSEIEALSKQVGLPLLAKFRASYERIDAINSITSVTPANPIDSTDQIKATRRAAPDSNTSDPSTSTTSSKTPTTKTPATTSSRPSSSTPRTEKPEPSLLHTQPIRSGQQIYAQNRDLTVCAMVGAGAEVIADGSIHIYGALRGRALAGAGGLSTARIFCREFNAELVAIAGTYKVLEEIPKKLIGKPVQIWLEGESLHIEEQT